ncbi:MAG: DUF6785 family protein, partial [Armatimonadota bacterium]
MSATEGRRNLAASAVRVLAVGFIFLVLANLWVRQGALITLASQVAMAVPPVPALAVLVLLLAALPVIRHVGFDKKQIIGIYCFLTLAVALTSGGAMRFFLPSLPSLFYFATPDNNWSQFHQHIPDWFAPKDPEVIREYFEGSATGAVPWEAWLGPLAAWLGFFVAFFGLLICLALIFRPVWEQDEYLTYPLAELPLMLAGEQSDYEGIWTDSVFWVGFGLVCAHHVLNIANAFNPSVAALGLRTDLGALLPEWPLSSLQPLQLAYRPFMFGLGYLMPTEILFSSVFFYLIYLKGLSLGSALMGYTLPQFPYRDNQGGGAFLAMALVLIYGARRRIAAVFGRLSGRGGGSRMLPAATIVSILAMIIFWRMAGMNWLILLGFFGLMFAYALSYARVRAESGFPHNWIRPLRQERDMLINFLGTRRLQTGGGFRSLTLLSSVFYMCRGYLPQLIAFPLESFKISGEVKIKLNHMVWLMLAAVLLGIGVSWWMHLDAYYQYGANILEGGTTSGGYRIQLMVRSYTDLAAWARQPEGPKTLQAGAS